MARRRQVVRSAELVAKAELLYPTQRSPSGRPSFGDFERGPLAAAEDAFGLNFERQREFIEGVGSVRYFIASSHPAFQPLVFTACLMRGDVIEITSVVEDQDYWDLIENDPPD